MKVLFTVNRKEREAKERIFDQALEMLKKECSVEVNPSSKDFNKDDLKGAIRGVDGVFCLLTNKFDAEVIEAAPNLKVIANMAVGYDNIDIKAANERGIMVTNTPGVLTETTADLTWALLMATARRIPEAENFLRAGKFHGWRPTLLLGRDLYGTTLGIVGMGRIGRAVARRALGFEMQVIWHDFPQIAKEIDAIEAFWKFKKPLKYAQNLKELLVEADFVTVHVPLTPETRHLIGERELSLMKSTAYLINTSRGPVVDEKALAKALKEGKIAGAGLDVFEEEPKVHPELLKLKNVVLLPHIGSSSIATRTKMANMTAENLLAGLKGTIPPNLVNKEVISKYDIFD